MDSQTASEQINTVVDNVADKVGIAAEKLIPVADRAIDEIAIRGLGMTIFIMVIAIVIVIAGILIRFLMLKFSKTAKKEEDKEGWQIGSTIILVVSCIIAIIVSIVGAGSWLPEYFAPTVTLIERIL